jgi:hypothetical protein
MYKHSLSEFPLRNFSLTNGVTVTDILVRGGRTGRMVHVATSGSSCLGCGHWCKYVVNNWKLTIAQADHLERCEKCFGGQWIEKVQQETI